MPERSEKQANRAAIILKELRQAGSTSIEGLCTKLNVSVATVRRDLEDLENSGLLRRTRGGAIVIEPLFYEAFRDDRSFQSQVESFADEKRRIALAASEFISPGNTIALTAGTTTTEVVRSLRSLSGITVVTNTVNVAMELSNRKDIHVFVTGGHLRGDWFSLVGPAAVASMSGVFADVLFVGVNGINAEHGLTCFNDDEVDINRCMVRQAKRKIAVADHSKLGVVANWLICPTDVIDMLITDNGATDKMIAPFIAQGIDVRRV
ncbi:MAG: DeoR/GlpR family DNA-binding transcription regulator [Acidobacteriaceae bacterium]|nr:DeoR/GlpR family DNA-binding transcription regulator [Acidobacteriaceae bacterium]